MSDSKSKKSRLSRLKKKYEGMCLTGKVCFSSKLDADISIMHRNSKNGQETLSRSYKCKYCGFWHLTSKVRSFSGWEYKR